MAVGRPRVLPTVIISMIHDFSGEFEFGAPNRAFKAVENAKKNRIRREIETAFADPDPVKRLDCLCDGSIPKDILAEFINRLSPEVEFNAFLRKATACIRDAKLANKLVALFKENYQDRHSHWSCYGFTKKSAGYYFWPCSRLNFSSEPAYAGFLRERGSQVNWLLFAIQMKNVFLVKALCREVGDNLTPLCPRIAIQAGSPEIMHILLHYGMSPFSKCSDDRDRDPNQKADILFLEQQHAQEFFRCLIIFLKDPVKHPKNSAYFAKKERLVLFLENILAALHHDSLMLLPSQPEFVRRTANFDSLCRSAFARLEEYINDLVKFSSQCYLPVIIELFSMPNISKSERVTKLLMSVGYSNYYKSIIAKLKPYGFGNFLPPLEQTAESKAEAPAAPASAALATTSRPSQGGKFTRSDSPAAPASQSRAAPSFKCIVC